jgi:hypothetical protein
MTAQPLPATTRIDQRGFIIYTLIATTLSWALQFLVVPGLRETFSLPASTRSSEVSWAWSA